MLLRGCGGWASQNPKVVEPKWKMQRRVYRWFINWKIKETVLPASSTPIKQSFLPSSTKPKYPFSETGADQEKTPWGRKKKPDRDPNWDSDPEVIHTVPIWRDSMRSMTKLTKFSSPGKHHQMLLEWAPPASCMPPLELYLSLWCLSCVLHGRQHRPKRWTRRRKPLFRPGQKLVQPQSLILWHMARASRQSWWQHHLEMVRWCQANQPTSYLVELKANQRFRSIRDSDSVESHCCAAGNRTVTPHHQWHRQRPKHPKFHSSRAWEDSRNGAPGHARVPEGEPSSEHVGVRNKSGRSASHSCQWPDFHSCRPAVSLAPLSRGSFHPGAAKPDRWNHCDWWHRNRPPQISPLSILRCCQNDAGKHGRPPRQPYQCC